MREPESREPVPLRRISVRETNRLDVWEASVIQRNEIYAAVLGKAMDAGMSTDEARLVARKAFLDSFEVIPEAEYAVSLAGTEVAPLPRRGRRAA